MITRHWLLLCAGVVGWTPAAADGAWRTVRGPDLLSTFVDHELADGVHYAYRFNKDGTLNGFVMGKQVSGTWRVSGDEFCWRIARRGADEDCYQVELHGHSVRLLRDGYEAFTATITPVKSPEK